MAVRNHENRGAVSLDAMLKVNPVDPLSGKESDTHIRRFLNDAQRFKITRQLSNQQIVKEIEPYLTGRAREIYELAKHKRMYKEYDVTNWEPAAATAAVEQVLGADGNVVTPAVPAVPAVEKGLMNLLKDLLIQEATEDTVRAKLRTEKAQRPGEPFNEFSDRIRLMVFNLHQYTYSNEQRELDANHEKEFQESMVLIKENTYGKLWDFLVSMNYVTNTGRTEADFVKCREGAKVWEASAEGRNFLASKPPQKTYFSAGPACPTLAEPVQAQAVAAIGAAGKKKKKSKKKSANKQNKQKKGASKEASGKKDIRCEYCGIENSHTVDVCMFKKRDVERGIHLDRVEGYPRTPRRFSSKPANPTSSIAPSRKTSENLRSQDLSSPWDDFSSVEWGGIIEGSFATPTHGSLQPSQVRHQSQQ